MIEENKLPPKEPDTFRKYGRHNKLLTLGIGLAIAVVLATTLYFTIKVLIPYTVTYHLNGGSVYMQELKPTQYRFLERVQEPQNVKKEGYYIEYWSEDKNLSSKFTFGKPIWSSINLYAKWSEGVAVRLHFATGEENADMSTADLKGYFEQYIKAGSSYTLPIVKNTKEGSLHYGEQLFWYDNPECTGEPFAEKTYEAVTENIDLYGCWFDVDESKFEVKEGVLTKYLGRCNKIMLPNNIYKIKSVSFDKFGTGENDGVNEQDGGYSSVWQYVMSDETGVNGLKLIYLNENLQEIGECGFRQCEALERVYFRGRNIRKIGKYAFAECDKLYVLDIPDTITTIESNVFDGAFDRKKNVEINLGSNITTIEDKAFINSNIYKITLGNVRFIGRSAFASCNNLHDFIIKTPVLVESNFDGDGVTTDPKAIFFGVTIIEPHRTLKIYIPSGLKGQYLSKNYWAMYSGFISEQ